ncbi:LOW QUALITY PROTEIN: puromycin-sensitive aminopeptidase-like [Homalodisca vitripennis]|uniref:LOW QUALITY PROTEIN: puromycin-sensitive aminopeptidase-like n=1 Tax=Homalodisca vitripennis TaxID=197043 RepID=UPI001EEA2CC5|nr:LOW QUALITY PROTEIN: puromycin-sensitive aminopeptidase-like [Homalodisca vitripennis]
MPEKKHFERLPKSVIPKNYELFLRPNLTKFTFEGKVKIDIKINEPTNKIVMNAIELEITEAELTTAEGRTVTPARSLSTETETLTLDLAETLTPGDAQLHISFLGQLNDKMKGFYRSKYTLGDEERYAAVTQFESTDARRCFPCWDEPAIKATFDITLAVQPEKTALSNMPVESEKVEGGERTVTFARTPIMSTYLVAVVVGDYDYIEDTSTDGVKVRVYTPVGKQEQGRFALHVATKVLPYYKDYFNIAYPLPKIDLIAISDFSAGAMENWGLVTYREVCLLVDAENTSTARKQLIALVVGHELAHQWFGNLVTMEWWTHLWLNEGYASFVEFLCVAHLFPEYDIWTQFVTDMYIPALQLDCLNNSHPIEVPVGHPNEIEEIFDDISYNKGASVIRMLNNYIGDNDFRAGMYLYLTRHQYGNTFTEDLWAALEEASSKPVADVMTTWTKQMGFPVITVEKATQEGDARVFTLSQAKFCADPRDAQKENESLWLVPISFSKAGAPDTACHTVMMRERQMTVRVEGVAPKDWVKLNPGTVGYYRTRYPPAMLQQLQPAIQDKSLPPLDRLGLLDDLFALVQAGQSQTVEVLKLMEAMNQEDNYTVWCTIANCLTKLQVLLSNTEFEDKFKLYGLKLLGNIGQKLGWEPKPHESHLDTLLRSLVLNRLATYGDQAVIAESHKRFQQHVSGESPLPADLRSVVYRAVLSDDGEKTYDTMIKLYKESDLHEEQSRISHALGSIRDEKLLRKVLDFAMSPDVRSQDTVFVIISVAMTKLGRDLAWNFIKDNWATFLKRYEGGGGLLGRLVKRTTENFASEQRAVEIEEFFASHDAPGCERSLQQTCESIRVNTAWLARDRESVQDFLSKLS